MMKNVIQYSIEQLKYDFINNIEDFFYTEKEIHSWFLKICFSNMDFVHKGHLLVHAEYPTPFKCSYGEPDTVILEANDSNKMRAHIDMVVINPAYVDWVLDSKKSMKYLSGITQSGLFSKFHAELIDGYKEFYKETHEPVLEYAIEFKFLRHSFLGSKYPIKGVIQDLKKLQLLKGYSEVFNNEFSLVEKTLAAVFIGERGGNVKKDLLAEIESNKYDIGSYSIVSRDGFDSV